MESMKRLVTISLSYTRLTTTLMARWKRFTIR